MDVIIYTDGGADPNPGIGGWGAILRYGDREKELSGNEPQTTNNRMELTAAINALQALKRPSTIQFYTDSEYLRRGITEWIAKWAANGWVRGKKKPKPVPNAELWQTLWELTQQHEISWHWVKGHAGDRYNERVDQLARDARLAITPGATIDPDTPRLYVRASCRGNPGPGGWGAVLEQGEETEQMSGWEPRTTNNRMELTAVIEGLRLLPPGPIQLFTTSDYVYQGATRWIHGWRRRGWQKKEGGAIANGDLWQQIDRLQDRYQLHWINSKGQERPGLQEASALAVRAAESAVSGGS